MDNETLRIALNVIKAQIVQTFEKAEEAADRQMTFKENALMVELLGRLSNAQEVLNVGWSDTNFLLALGQIKCWEETKEARGEEVATQVFGPRAA